LILPLSVASEDEPLPFDFIDRFRHFVERAVRGVRREWQHRQCGGRGQPAREVPLMCIAVLSCLVVELIRRVWPRRLAIEGPPALASSQVLSGTVCLTSDGNWLRFPRTVTATHGRIKTRRRHMLLEVEPPAITSVTMAAGLRDGLTGRAGFCPFTGLGRFDARPRFDPGAVLSWMLANRPPGLGQHLSGFRATAGVAGLTCTTSWLAFRSQWPGSSSPQWPCDAIGQRRPSPSGERVLGDRAICVRLGAMGATLARPGGAADGVARRFLAWNTPISHAGILIVALLTLVGAVALARRAPDGCFSDKRTFPSRSSRPSPRCQAVGPSPAPWKSDRQARRASAEVAQADRSVMLPSCHGPGNEAGVACADGALPR
jgi:hypothetical protein